MRALKSFVLVLSLLAVKAEAIDKGCYGFYKRNDYYSSNVVYIQYSFWTRMAVVPLNKETGKFFESLPARGEICIEGQIVEDNAGLGASSHRYFYVYDARLN